MLSIAFPLAILLLDKAWRGHNLLEKYSPDWTWFGCLKVVASALAATCLFAALRQNDLTFRSGDGGDGEGRLIVWGSLVTTAILILSTMAVVLAPHALEPLVRENGAIGIATNFVLGAGTVLFLVAAWHSRRPGSKRTGIPLPLMLLTAALVSLLILMEEMSWGQHLFGWSAGSFFESNLQRETNLHNFSTYRFEAAYYTAAFVFFVAVPAFWANYRPDWMPGFDMFVPPRLFALAGLPIISLFYEEWNVVPYQVMFFVGLLISVQLVYALGSADKLKKVWWTGMLLLAVLPLSEIVFLTEGHRLIRGYELSEIRELLIASLIAFYALIIARRTYRSNGSYSAAR